MGRINTEIYEREISTLREQLAIEKNAKEIAQANNKRLRQHIAEINKTIDRTNKLLASIVVSAEEH